MIEISMAIETLEQMLQNNKLILERAGLSRALFGDALTNTIIKNKPQEIMALETAIILLKVLNNNQNKKKTEVKNDESGNSNDDT